MEILVPGEVIVGAEGSDSGTEDFMLDLVLDNAIVDVLSEVLVEHVVHAHALEIGDTLTLEVVVVRFDRGTTGEIGLPFGLAEESLPESSELLASIPGVSMSPVEVSGSDVHLVLDGALHEVLFNQLLGTFLAPES